MQTGEGDEADASERTQARWVEARRRVRPWLLTLVVLVVLVAGIGLAGGWRAAPADAGRGRLVPLGKEIRLERWKITVLGAELVNLHPKHGYQIPDTIMLRIALMNRTEKTRNDFPVTVLGQRKQGSPGLLTVDPQISERPDTVSGEGPLGPYEIHPQITQPWTVKIAYERGVTVTAPADIVVVVRGEEQSKGLGSNPLADDQVISEQPIGHLLVPLADRRTR